jgi:hypothetical protein
MKFLDRMRRSTSVRVKTFAAGALVTALAALGSASPALAQPHHPTGEFAQFGDCPLSITNLTECVYSVTNGGSFTLGKKTVPLKNPVTLQGGFIVNAATEKLEFKGAEDGNTLSKTPQPVPGGFLGITAPTWWPEWLQEEFNEFINEGFTGVQATVELAAPAEDIGLSTENLINEEGTALELPVKIKLSNPFLGNSCYIGSNENPVVIPFTTGTSGSVKGSAGELSFNEEFTLITISGGKLVNGTYSAPGASGCGGWPLEYLIDPFVNSIVGIPSGSGSNTAILEGKLQTANAAAVKASE